MQRNHLRVDGAKTWGLLILVGLLAACGGNSDQQSQSQPEASSASDGPTVKALAVKPADAPRAPVEPLSVVAVPDVNELGVLDRSGPNGGSWTQITNQGQKDNIRQLGKALFWDMQVGGDGVQACASCHFNAGADHRIVNQVAAGAGTSQQFLPLNRTLTPMHFQSTANGKPNSGLAVSEQDLRNAGATPDSVIGAPGLVGVLNSPSKDVKDVVGSQGTRTANFKALGDGRLDLAEVSTEQRQVTGRNSPSVINAVYNLRNFWDGRADTFFNGVNPLGFRDPDALVKTFVGGRLVDERLNIPFSSLASQAVGPIGSNVEMTLGARSLRELGKKLTRTSTVPLAGQTVAVDDSLLAALRGSEGRGLNKAYATFIRQTFDQRFWGDGNGRDLCLTTDGKPTPLNATSGTCDGYTLMQWNFPLFFGLSIQAYLATQRSDDTIVDLIAGGKANGVVRNGKTSVDVTGMALDGCVAVLAASNKAADVAAATDVCATHYAKFIHPKATAGEEAPSALFPVARGAPVGGCELPASCATSPNNANGKNTLLNVNEGLKRFSTGATGCADCHFNPEFTGATVSTITGFGAKLPPLANGLARKDLLRRAVMERMVTFTGATAVYDTGFYNLGVRPTPEDLSLGNSIGGVPLALTRLFDVFNGAPAGSLDAAKIKTIGNSTSGLVIPTSATDITPIPFPFGVGCGPNPNAQNNINNCAATIVPGERLQYNGTFKAPGLRNVKFTGPYMHNGSKMTLRQVLEFYKTAGHFSTLNANNMPPGMKVFSLSAAEESSMVEMMETGLTDWRVAYQSGPFDHPELCVTNGHNETNGKTRVAALPAVGKSGASLPIPTFSDMLAGNPGRTNALRDGCSVPGIAYDPATAGAAPPTTAADLILLDILGNPI